MKEEENQQQESEFGRDKDRAIAAGVGAVIGGAAFATAAYSAGIWDDHSETEAANESSETEGQHTTANEMVHPEIVSVDDSTTATAFTEIGISENSIPAFHNEVNIIHIDSSEVSVESIEYLHGDTILQSDEQVIMDMTIEQPTTMPSIDGLDSMRTDDIITDDSHLHLI